MDVDGRPGMSDPMLLTRRAVAADLPALRSLWAQAGLAHDAGMLVAEGGVLLLVEVTAAHGASPLALAAIELDPALRRARLVGMAVAAGFRRRGFGRRLLTDAATLLQARGYEHLLARARDASMPAAFVEACRFVPLAGGSGPTPQGGADRFRGVMGECRTYVREL